MQKVPHLTKSEFQDLPEETFAVTSLEVGRSKHGSTLFLNLKYHNFGVTDGGEMRFALSPPAAAQLSRSLRKSVKAYLQSDDGSEGTDQS